MVRNDKEMLNPTDLLLRVVKKEKLIDFKSIKGNQIVVQVYILYHNLIYFLSHLKLTIYQTTIFIIESDGKTFKNVFYYLKCWASNMYSLILSRKPGQNLQFPVSTINHSGWMSGFYLYYYWLQAIHFQVGLTTSDIFSLL